MTPGAGMPACSSSRRVMISDTGRPVAFESSTARGSTSARILPPKPPPHSIGMTLMRASGMSRTSATSARVANDPWVLDQMVILPFGSKSAIAACGSMYPWWTIGTRKVFSTTRSACAIAVATSPRVSRPCWAMLGACVVVSVPVAAMPECAWASLVSAVVPWSATRGAVGSIDLRGSTAPGSTSYSTSIRSSASSAMARSSAATAATGWPANTTRSMASMAWARVLAIGFSSAMSAAVSTARTPGSARARVASMRVIRAWACGLRSSLA